MPRIQRQAMHSRMGQRIIFWKTHRQMPRPRPLPAGAGGGGVMGDTMLHAVLEMPCDLWQHDPVGELQRFVRYREASRLLYIYKTAFQSIAQLGCMQSKEEEEFFCKHDGSRHSTILPGRDCN